MPLARIDDTIQLLIKTKSDLLVAYERVEDLQHACRRLLGLISVISRNQQLPESFRESLKTSPEISEARELVGDIT